MPPTKKTQFKGTQRQFKTEEVDSDMAEKSSSERKLCITASADRPRPLPGKLANFVAVEGRRIVEMELFLDALTTISALEVSFIFLFFFKNDFVHPSILSQYKTQPMTIPSLNFLCKQTSCGLLYQLFSSY